MDRRLGALLRRLLRPLARRGEAGAAARAQPSAMNRGAPPRDIAVIGAGLVGLCTALALQEAGCRVIVLDRNPPGSGCSSGNAGGITPSAVVPIATPGMLAAVPKMLRAPLSPLAIRWSHRPHSLPCLVRFLHAGT